MRGCWRGIVIDDPVNKAVAPVLDLARSNVEETSVDTSKPAISRHFKTGDLEGGSETEGE